MAIDAVDDAVLGAILNDAQLLTLLPGRAYFVLAPEGVATPFAILRLQSDPPTYEHNQIAFTTARYAIRVHDRSNTKTAAQLAVDRIDTVLTTVPLTITGWNHMLCKRVDRFVDVTRDPAGVLMQERGADYEVWADPV